MSQVKLYQSVKLVTNKYHNEGLEKGLVGTILDIYDDENFEIEWYDNTGKVVACFAFKISDFEVID